MQVEIEAELSHSGEQVDIRVNGAHALSIPSGVDPYRARGYGGSEDDIVTRAIVSWLAELGRQDGAR